MYGNCFYDNPHHMVVEFYLCYSQVSAGNKTDKIWKYMGAPFMRDKYGKVFGGCKYSESEQNCYYFYLLNAHLNNCNKYT